MRGGLPVRNVCSIAFALAAVVAGSAMATTSGSPFYLVPSPTQECKNVRNCVAVTGPWVVVPAHGEATFLFGCPLRRGYIVGGTDARASSPSVRVWFEGQLGAPIGFPPSSVKDGAVLLFHAVSNNSRLGSFQPILGCVSLTQASKIATVSLVRAAALPGTSTSPPLDLRAKEVVIAPLVRRQTAERCGKGETAVGSWNALAFETTTPPDPSYEGAVTTTTVVSKGGVRASFEIMGILLTPLAPVSLLQIGAMCEP